MRQIKQQLLLTVALLLCSIGITNATIFKSSCGTNVTYTLDTATGVLNIEGRGEMTNWYYSSYAPWYSNRSYIKSASISDGVTSIGNFAFYDCSGLTSVTIPNSVTSIGISAFNGCSSLTKAEFASIESLCKISFGNFSANPLYSAHNLYIDGKEVKDLVIPNSVTLIGSSAFAGCSGLTSVTIPNSVTSIGNYAFQNCSGLTSVTIPNTVTSIGQSAFSGCSGLTSVTIPNSVTSIGDYTFYYCSGLTSVTIPNSVTSIGEGAFSGCM